MDPALAKRFRTGRTALDFAHTGGTGDWTEPELLYDRLGLEHWLAHILGVPRDGVEAGDGDVEAALRLRAAIWGLAHARIDDGRLADQDIRAVNAFAAAPPPVPVLTADGVGGPDVKTVVTAGAALSAIARDAIDLFSGPLGHRIRVCAADDCALLFVDASRPGTRRWCSMERCGNLAKIRTHRDKAAESSTTTAMSPRRAR